MAKWGKQGSRKPLSKLQKLSIKKNFFQYRLKGVIALLKEIDDCYTDIRTLRIHEDIVALSEHMDDVYHLQKLRLVKEH